MKQKWDKNGAGKNEYPGDFDYPQGTELPGSFVNALSQLAMITC